MVIMIQIKFIIIDSHQLAHTYMLMYVCLLHGLTKNVNKEGDYIYIYETDYKLGFCDWFVRGVLLLLGIWLAQDLLDASL